MCQISRHLLWKSPGMPKCHNRILFHYADILWAAIHRDYRDCVNFLPVFQQSLKNIKNIFLELSAGQVRQNCRATLVIPPGTSVATIVTISCNHRDGEYFLHRLTRKLGSTVTSTVITRLLPLTNYISGAENETQRAFLGHTNGNIEMRSPSAAAMLQPSWGSPQCILSIHICVTRPQWVNHSNYKPEFIRPKFGLYTNHSA